MKRESFIDEFILPFTLLTEAEGIQQGYTIIKTAEELETMAVQSNQYPFNIKLLLVNDITYINRIQLLFIENCELNGNGNRITTESHLFSQLGAGTHTCIVKNIKVTIDSTTATSSIVGYSGGGIIDNCIVDAKFSVAGAWGGVVLINNNGGIIRNCNVRVDAINGGDGTGGIANNNIASTIENCFVESTLNKADLLFGAIAYLSVGGLINNCSATISEPLPAIDSRNGSMHICPILINNATVSKSECYFKTGYDG